MDAIDKPLDQGHDDLAARLQSAVGDAYSIVEELPPSGTSRFFLATERQSSRYIVVRVIPADTSEAAVAHFRKAMGVVANLSHPFLLPMLAAGNAPGMLFYLVPRIPGETLRQRLDREFRTSVPEATRIITEIAEALHFAHRQGVVHGGIRPDLVILAADSAKLAGVGIANAIRPAQRGAAAPDGGAGGYLAPEQLREGAVADQRSDVYSLGILAYETLAGDAPYKSDAHAQAGGPLVAEPLRLAAVRRDVSRPLSDVVARAMSRDPAQRYRDPREFGRALEGAARATSARTKRLLLVSGLAAAVVAVLATVINVSRKHGIDDDLVAVAPFTVPDADRGVWREGIVDILSANLDGAGALRAVPASVALRGWRGDAEPDHASGAEFARRMGARHVVYGRVVPAGDGMVRASAFVVDAINGRTTMHIEFNEQTGHMDRVTDSLTLQVLRGFADKRIPRVVRISSFGSHSLPALASFLRGERFFRASAYDSARVAYRRALELDPQFVVAMSRLWRIVSRAGLTRDADFRESEAAGRRSAMINRGLAPLESIAVLRDSLVFVMVDAPSQKALRRLKAVVDSATQLYPRVPEVWMIAAEERSGFLQHLGTTNTNVLEASERAIALDSAFTPPYLTAFNSAWEAFGWESAMPYLEALLRHRPQSVEARGLTLLRRLHDSPPASDHRLPVDRIPSDVITIAMSYATMVQDSTSTALRLARLRLRHPAPLESQERAIIGATLLSHGKWREARSVGGVAAVAAELPLAPNFSPDSVERWTLAWVREAQAGVAPWRPHALLWRAAEMGRVDLLNAIARGAQAVARTSASRESEYVVQLAGALVPLATAKDTSAALMELQIIGEELCFLGCYPIRVGIARLLNTRGHVALAGSLLGGGDGAFSGLRFWAMPLTRTFWRLERARAFEMSRQPERAVADYRSVLTVLRDADPELKSVTDTARAGLVRIGR